MRTLLVLTLTIMAAAATAGAQTAIVPIVEMKTGGLLGGVQNGKWLPPAKVAPLIKQKAEFVLVGWNGVEEGGVSLAEIVSDVDGICEDYWSFNFELEMKEGVGLGTNAKWNPTPRKAVKIPSTNKIYRAAAADFLKTKGIKNPEVSIKQIYRIDLEGNGTEEVLISASHYPKGMYETQNAGDYSFTMLRKVVGKKAENYLIEGEFFPGRAPKDHWPPNVYEFSGVADLNGDGVMEVIVSSQYYEGGSTGVFQMKNGKPVAIKELAISCGL